MIKSKVYLYEQDSDEINSFKQYSSRGTFFNRLMKIYGICKNQDNNENSYIILYMEIENNKPNYYVDIYYKNVDGEFRIEFVRFELSNKLNPEIIGLNQYNLCLRMLKKLQKQLISSIQ